VLSVAGTTPRRLGFAEVMRQGWKPPERLAGGTGKPGPAATRAAGAGAGGGTAVEDGGPTDPELLKQRKRLARQFAELQWDLGGMTYEMASRDHMRLDVLVKQAARLQDVDAQLGQVERMLRMTESGAAGACPSCGGLQARGAVFCWQCGKELRPAAEPAQKPKVG
jgi:hypothetical protein